MKNTGHYHPRSCLLPLSALLFLVAAIGLWKLLKAGENADSSSPFALQPVQRQEMGTMKYRDVAEKRLPVILTGTIADRWPARDKFTSAFLAKRLPQVSAHKQESKRSFITFHDDKPLEPLVPVKWEDFNVKVNTTIPEILQWNNHQRSNHVGPYMYYSQDIATLRDQFPDVIGYVQPVKPLILSQEYVQVNLWVGREGLVTHTHYDCTYNFFVQLEGTKRFTLFPPAQSLYLYPCLHPHYGHSQVDILQPSMDKYPDYSSKGGFVAEVSPGDMLVVPPFWFHHVETLSDSVSVNVWSDAPEYALLNEIYSLPVPFEEDWSWRDLLTATKLYLYMIIGSLDVGPPTSFVRHLLEQRYAPLVSSKSLFVNETLLNLLDEECNQVVWQEQMDKFENILSNGVDVLKKLFTDIPTRLHASKPVVKNMMTGDPQPGDTMKVCLANYVEHLVYSVIGLDYVYPFLATCAWRQ